MTLNLHLLSPQDGQSHTGNQAELLEQAYSFWNERWRRIYSSQGAIEFFSSDDFLRLKWIQVYTHLGKVVGFLGHSVFSPKSASSLSHKYMKFFGREFVTQLEESGVRTLLSFEYLLVDPRAYRQGVSRSLSEIMIGNGLQLLKDSGLDMAIAVARRDNGVCDRGNDWGWTHAIRNLEKRNFPVDVMTCGRESVVDHKDFETLRLTRQLWNSRNQENNLENIKIAA
jgi:hypothetical protein